MDMQVTNLDAILADISSRFAERSEQHDADDSFVAENYAELKERRVFSALVPAELGGGGQPYTAMAGFLRGLAPHCASTALALAMHQHLLAAAVWNHRQGNPGRKLLEAVADGEKVLISTGANDWMSSSGHAERTDGGFLVTAKKPFGSGGPAGDIIVTSAPYDDPEDGPQVLHFPVPMAADGVSSAGDWQAMGMRGTGSHTLVLDKVFVPDEAVAVRRPAGRYHPLWNIVITVAMPLITSVYAGIADAAHAKAAAAVRGRPADDILCQQLGAMGNQHAVVDLAVRDMVATVNDWDFLNDNAVAAGILTRKCLAAEAAQATVRAAVETVGGGAFLRRAGLERLLRDVTGAQFHPLPEKRQQVFAGRVALGLDPATGAPVD